MVSIDSFRHERLSGFSWRVSTRVSNRVGTWLAAWALVALGIIVMVAIASTSPRCTADSSAGPSIGGVIKIAGC
jgi:hypothetical protein